MRASTTDGNEAYSDLDARIDPLIYVAILNIGTDILVLPYILWHKSGKFHLIVPRSLYSTS